MLKAALLAFATAISALLCSCSSGGVDFKPTEEEKLNEAESAALIAHARNFIAGNKRLKLSEAERQTVKAERPETSLKYTAPKEGEIALSWQLSESRRLILLTQGKLLSEGRQLWQVKIISGQPVVFGEEKPKEPEPLPGKGGKSP